MDVKQIIKEFEQIGYTHEEAMRLIEQATQPVDLSHIDIEFEKFVDEWNKIGCTSYRFISDEMKNRTIKENRNA